MQKRCSGFSLAEMMVVMLIISILTAAMLPVITKRQKDAGGGRCLWSESPSNSADIYSRESADTVVLAGTTARINSGSEKLQINSTSPGVSQIAFAENGTKTGTFMADSSHNLLIGNGTKAGTQNSTGIGTDVSIYGNGSVAIGSSAQALAGASVAIGASATNNPGTVNQVALGTRANSTGNLSTAVGYLATVSGDAGTAIGNQSSATSGASAFGTNAIASQSNSVAIGTNAIAVDGGGSIGIGINSKATAYNSIAIGNTAHATPIYNSGDAIAIGMNSQSSYDTALAIGNHARASGPGSSAFGRDSTAVSEGSTALGFGSNSGQSYSIAIGAYATTSAAHQIMLGSASDDVVFMRSFNKISDRRLKNIKGLNNDGLSKILEVKTYNFSYKKDKFHRPEVGAIAQEIQKIFPNAITKDDNGFLMMRTDDIFYAMVNSIKELNSKIEKLGKEFQKISVHENSTDKKIDELYKKYNNLNNQVYTLKKENKTLKAQLTRFQSMKH